MATMSRKRLARYVADELQHGADANELMRHVAAYLIEHKRPHDVQFVIDEIAAELASRGAKGLVTVTTARPLGPDERKNIQAFAMQKMHVAAVELDERVDPGIIGGIIIETPDARYDRSLKHGIEQLTSV